jgi:hypothetical protein
MSTNYAEAVTEARQLVKRSEADQWRLAQLTAEQLAAGATTRQWAEDIGMSQYHVSIMSRVWRRWGENSSFQRPRYAEAYAMVRERAETPADARRSTNEHQAIGTVRKMTPERKVQVAREILAEPAVAEQVVRDRHAAADLARAEVKVSRERSETARRDYELAEPRSHQIGAYADLSYTLSKARTAFDDALAAADTLAAAGWPDKSRETGRVLVQRALAAGELVRAKVEGRDPDEELAELLRTEGGE